jgi:hypothetical protein
MSFTFGGNGSRQLNMFVIWFLLLFNPLFLVVKFSIFVSSCEVLDLVGDVIFEFWLSGNSFCHSDIDTASVPS